MAITVIRNTGWSPMQSTIHIRLNGGTIVEIENIRQVDINLPSRHATLSVIQSKNISDKLYVIDSEMIEITSRKEIIASILLIGYLLLIGMILLIPFIHRTIIKILLLLLGIFISRVSALIVNKTYQLKELKKCQFY